MKYLIFLIGLICVNLNAQITFDQFNSDYIKEPKPILIYFSTEWCSYCMLQKKQVQDNIQLLQLLNDQFYYLEVNAESNKNITFLNQIYYPKAENSKDKTHSFFEEFIQPHQQFSFPFWVLLSDKLIIEFYHSGLIKDQQLLLLLKHYLAKV